MDRSLLKALGLQDKEISLYSAVMKAGRITPAALAKAIGVKRTTGYSMARNLVEKGLLVEDATRRPRVFTLAGPEAIKGAIVLEKKRSDERQELLTRLSAEVSKRNAETAYPVPQVRFVEEGKIEKFLYDQLAVWHTSMTEKDGIWWGFQDHTLVDEYFEWIKWTWKFPGKKWEAKMLTNRSVTEVKLSGRYPARGVKFWGEATSFISTTWIIGDYVVMINTRQKPYYLVEIHSALLAHDQREVFRNLWPLVP